ncbi:MAG: hypothetical protein WC891_03040 [Actinomycetota bacterium]
MALSVQVTGIDGRVYRWEEEISTLNFSKGVPGGCLTVTADLPIAKLARRDDARLFQELKISEGADSVWEGRIEGVPRTSSAENRNITVNALGWWAHAKDEMAPKRYLDADLEHWEDTGYASDYFGVDKGDDDDPMLKIWLNGGVTPPNLSARSYRYQMPKYYYSDTFPSEEWPRSISFDYVTNYDNARVTLRLIALRPGYFSTEVWRNNVYGSSSGSATVALPDHTRQIWVEFFVHSGSFLYPYPTGEWYGLIKNVKVCGLTTGATTTVSNVISNLLALCPKWSTDYSKIANITRVVNNLVFDDPKYAQDMILETIGLDKGMWNIGIWKDKMLEVALHDQLTVHYNITTAEAEISDTGESSEQTYNKAYCSFEHPLFGKVYAKATQAQPDLDTHSTTRAGMISSSSHLASEVATDLATFLANHNRPRFMGDISVPGVRDANNNWVPFSRIEVGRNIRITDLDIPEPTATSVLDGKTTFRIVFAEYDYVNRRVKLSLDTPPRLGMGFAPVAPDPWQEKQGWPWWLL